MSYYSPTGASAVARMRGGLFLARARKWASEESLSRMRGTALTPGKLLNIPITCGHYKLKHI